MSKVERGQSYVEIRSALSDAIATGGLDTSYYRMAVAALDAMCDERDALVAELERLRSSDWIVAIVKRRDELEFEVGKLRAHSNRQSGDISRVTDERDALAAENVVLQKEYDDLLERAVQHGVVCDGNHSEPACWDDECWHKKESDDVHEEPR